MNTTTQTYRELTADEVEELWSLARRARTPMPKARAILRRRWEDRKDELIDDDVDPATITALWA